MPYTGKRVTGGTKPDGCSTIITKLDQPPCPSAYFDEGGAQIYPPPSQFVQRTNVVPQRGETDSVFFPN